MPEPLEITDVTDIYARLGPIRLASQRGEDAYAEYLANRLLVDTLVAIADGHPDHINLAAKALYSQLSKIYRHHAPQE